MQQDAEEILTSILRALVEECETALQTAFPKSDINKARRQPYCLSIATVSPRNNFMLQQSLLLP